MVFFGLPSYIHFVGQETSRKLFLFQFFIKKGQNKDSLIIITNSNKILCNEKIKNE